MVRYYCGVCAHDRRHVDVGGHQARPSQVRVRHILIKCDFNDPVSRADALELIKSLRKRIVEGGEDFGEIARNYSNDASSSFRGGELPPATKGTYDEAFDQFAWTADIGEISQPIQTTYGYHLVQVLSRTYSEGDLAEQRIKEKAMEEMREDKTAPKSTPKSAPKTDQENNATK